MEKGNDRLLRESINTLGQSGTTDFSNPSNLPGKMVYGLGSDLENKAPWRGRAKRKFVSQILALRLVEVVEKKGEAERARPYWNAYHCQNNLTSREGRIYGKYCKNRCCLLCCSIRKAEIINRYQPEIQTWKDPYFVTLTIRSVPAERLEWAFRGIKRAFRQIREKYKKKNQRGKGLKLMGVESLECNFNPVAKTYNPHLHLIVPDKETAVTLIVEWLKKWTMEFAGPWAQYKRKVKCVESDLVETIKYGSKVFTEPDLKNKGKNKVPPMVYAAALDAIFYAMKPYRIFERFGFNLPKQAGCSKKSPIFLEQFEEWEFKPSIPDWHNSETGELLAGYFPTPQLLFLLGQNVDTDLR